MNEVIEWDFQKLISDLVETDIFLSECFIMETFLFEELNFLAIVNFFYATLYLFIQA